MKKKIAAVFAFVIACVAMMTVLVGCGSPQIEHVYNSAAVVANWKFAAMDVGSYESLTVVTYSDGTYMCVDEIVSKESMLSGTTDSSGNFDGGATDACATVAPFRIVVVSFGSGVETRATTEADGEDFADENVVLTLGAAERIVYYGNNSFYNRTYGYLDTGDESTFAMFNESNNVYADPDASQFKSLFDSYGCAKTLIVDTTQMEIKTTSYLTNAEYIGSVLGAA